MITSNLKNHESYSYRGFVGAGLCAYAQQLAVKGGVLDEAGEPIIGAYITLQGNNNVGTITDFDGNFKYLWMQSRNSYLTPVTNLRL